MVQSIRITSPHDVGVLTSVGNVQFTTEDLAAAARKSGESLTGREMLKMVGYSDDVIDDLGTMIA